MNGVLDKEEALLVLGYFTFVGNQVRAPPEQLTLPSLPRK